MQPIYADKWILLSGLQKAIRRNDTDYAQRFALSLFRIDKRSFWRRLPVIALEDIGLGDADLMLEVCKATYEPAYRMRRGDEGFVIELVTYMANASKNHAIDHLIKIVSVMPPVLDKRRDCKTMVLDDALDVVTRAVAMMAYNAAIKVQGVGLYQPTIAALHKALRPSKSVYEASQLTLSRMDNDMPLLIPLLDTKTKGQKWRVRQTNFSSEGVDDVPYWSFDPLHTRLGKAAIRRWKHETPELKSFTERQIAKAVFNTESIALGVERYCDQTDQVKADGITASLVEGNLPRHRQHELLSVVHQTFSALNRCRAEVWHSLQSTD